MNLYVIRHGETKWNRKSMLQGWKNSDLTDEGMEAARDLRDSFKEKDLKFDAIFTSTQQRSIDTAEIIRDEDQVDIIQIDELKELGFGKWDGMLLEDVHREHEEQYVNYMNNPELYTPTSGGETFDDLFERVKVALDKIINSGYENVLVVTHGVTIKAIISLVEDIGIDKFNDIPIYKGTALNKFVVENGEIDYIIKGDTSHLRR